VASAEALPFPADTVDATLSQLVVNLMTNAAQGLREMARVTRPRAVIASCVWDYSREMTLLRARWASTASARCETEWDNNPPIVPLRERAMPRTIATTPAEILFRGLRAVMVFVDHPAASAAWYAHYVGGEVRVENNDFAWIDVGGVEFGFHRSDGDKNANAGSPVIYWSVESVSESRAQLIEVGCLHHRGPLVVDEARHICQMVDPFGVVFGLDGRP
jgi:SAM-dependent methyltransferase